MTATVTDTRTAVADMVLDVRDLDVRYYTEGGVVRAVDGVSFALRRGERFGLVGESGSGKATMGLALIGAVKRPGRVEGGQAILDGVDLLGLSEAEMRQRRMRDIAMIPQGAMNFLNPVMRVRDQVIDGMRAHGMKATKAEFEDRVAGLMRSVGLQPEMMTSYPHELSGGMKQRVSIAIAISLTPKVIIADEPTSALDVVVQRQVVETLLQVQREIGAATILIGHDMGLMAQFSTSMGIMYGGKLVELGSVEQVFHDPRHPYTKLLISSLPDTAGKRRLEGIPGLPPSLLERPPGCIFHPRCPYVMEQCRTESPMLREVEADGHVACHLFTETMA